MAAQFSWAAAADVGTGIAGAISAWGTASANNIVTRANIEAQRVVRDAQNHERAGNISLAATMRSIAYRNALTNAGEQSNSAAEVTARTMELWTGRNFEQGIKNAEQLGAYTARAAAAGVGGSSVRAVSYTVKLQQDRLAQQTEEQQGQMSYEMARSRAGIMPAAVSRLDVSPLNPNLDYSQNIAPAGNDGGLVGYLTQGLLSKSKSLQVALDSIPTSSEAVNLGTVTGADLSAAFTFD